MSPKAVQKATIFTITEDSPRGEDTHLSDFDYEFFTTRTFFLPEDHRQPDEPDTVQLKAYHKCECKKVMEGDKIMKKYR